MTDELEPNKLKTTPYRSGSCKNYARLHAQLRQLSPDPALIIHTWILYLLCTSKIHRPTLKSMHFTLYV